MIVEMGSIILMLITQNGGVNVETGKLTAVSNWVYRKTDLYSPNASL